MPAVSVAIPVRNERDHIEASLRSILAQEVPSGGLEILVADGRSDDGTHEILRRLAAENPSLRIIDNPRRIVSTGLNEAIKTAKGQIIIRMDAHTEYAPDYVRQCVNTLLVTNADNVGGPWVAKGEGLISGAIAAAFHSAFGAGGAKSHNPSYEGIADSVYLGCWRREVFDRIGLFDEELVRNQDDEFNLRLTRNGGKIWQSPRIRSWYRPRPSIRALFRQYLQYGYWKIRVIQKHKIPASVRHLIPGAFVVLLLALPVIGFWYPSALSAWLFLSGVYIAANLLASVLTASKSTFKFLWILPAVFACFHLAYGFGFLKGFWDFVIRRRAPGSTYTNLTRTSAKRS